MYFTVRIRGRTFQFFVGPDGRIFLLHRYYTDNLILKEYPTLRLDYPQLQMPYYYSLVYNDVGHLLNDQYLSQECLPMPCIMKRNAPNVLLRTKPTCFGTFRRWLDEFLKATENYYQILSTSVPIGVTTSTINTSSTETLPFSVSPWPATMNVSYPGNTYTHPSPLEMCLGFDLMYNSVNNPYVMPVTNFPASLEPLAPFNTSSASVNEISHMFGITFPDLPNTSFPAYTSSASVNEISPMPVITSSASVNEISPMPVITSSASVNEPMHVETTPYSVWRLVDTNSNAASVNETTPKPGIASSAAVNETHPMQVETIPYSVWRLAEIDPKDVKEGQPCLVLVLVEKGVKRSPETTTPTVDKISPSASETSASSAEEVSSLASEISDSPVEEVSSDSTLPSTLVYEISRTLHASDDKTFVNELSNVLQSVKVQEMTDSASPPDIVYMKLYGTNYAYHLKV